MEINSKQKAHLKSLAHHLRPVIIVGQNGLTESVIDEIGRALDHHELIKVKIAGQERDETKQMIVQIAGHLQCATVGKIGHTAIFYKQSEKRKIELP